MTTTTSLAFNYTAQRVRQREGLATDMLLFSVPAGDVKRWAGVPRKTFDYLNGFQRTLTESRIYEIATYFTTDVKNTSPTAIVVGFNETAGVSVEPLASQDGIELVRLKIGLTDLDA